MEQGGPDEEAKAIEESESVGCIGVSRRGGPPLIGYTLLRLFRNITWSKGLRIWHRLATPVYQHHRPPGTPLYFSDGKAVRCCATFYFVPKMKGLRGTSMTGSGRVATDVGSEDRFEIRSMDGTSSCLSMEGLSLDLIGDGDMSFSVTHGDDGASSSDGSSPLGWPLARRDRLSSAPSPSSSNLTSVSKNFMWEEKREKRETGLSEVEMMKERFAKLLLGEDMSGGGKGVCTALAISNAITNLSASVFGELWRLEPLPVERRTMWRREMEWLLSVSDHIVELVPSWQRYPDGSTLEVMVSRPRSDLNINLPALRKLDSMLLDSLESYHDTDFWYVDRGIAVAEIDSRGVRHSMQRQEEKWWLPTPKVPPNGLSENSKKHLHNQRDATSQILKAAMAINAQTLLEMEAPSMYFDSLPKNGRACLGDALYRAIASEHFSPDRLVSELDIADEHNILELANRLESAVLLWRRRGQTKTTQVTPREKFNAKSSWGKMKDLVGDMDRRGLFADRAESLLVRLKQLVPGMAQTMLDTNKIQFNRDVGQSILESYSRVLESLAFNIMARIDDVLYADDVVKKTLAPQVPLGRERSISKRMYSSRKRSNGSMHFTALSTPYVTPFISPDNSPSPSPLRTTPCSPREYAKAGPILVPSLGRALSDYLDLTEGDAEQEQEAQRKFSAEAARPWTYAGHLENSNALHSPPGRD